MSDEQQDADRGIELAQTIRPMLAGHSPAAQAAALADLVSMWLAGHFAQDQKTTERFREQMLDDFMGLVRGLVPVNEKWILKRIRREAS
jgi:hypothetical protein